MYNTRHTLRYYFKWQNNSGLSSTVQRP
jgi:hypothetical protein